MKKLFSLCVITLFSASLLMSGCSTGKSADAGKTDSQKEKTITLKYGELNPESHPMAVAGKEFANNVNKMSNGRIKIDIYAGGQLGDEKNMATLVQVGGGALDMMRIGSNTLGDFGADKMAIFSLPYIFRDRTHMWSVLNGPIGDELLKNVEEKDTRMVGLMYFDEGARHFFFTKKAVKSVNDLKNLKIRVPETQILMDTVKAFGASPTPISYSELYSALQTGVVDGAENPVTGYLSNNFNEVGKYMTLDAHTYSPSILAISKSVWNKLADEDKKILKDASKETEKFIKSNAEKADNEALAKLKEKGAEITDVPDKTEWQKAVAPVYEKYAAQQKDLIQKIRDVK